MATVEEFVSWMMRDLSRFGPIDDHVEVVERADGLKFVGDVPETAERLLIVRLYTDGNRYQIKAVERDDGSGYLGCTAGSRKPRAGEDWTRGRDLADGPLDENTWRKILCEIVSFEMVRVHHRPGKRIFDGINDAGRLFDETAQRV